MGIRLRPEAHIPDTSCMTQLNYSLISTLVLPCRTITTNVIELITVVLSFLYLMRCNSLLASRTGFTLLPSLSSPQGRFFFSAPKIYSGALPLTATFLRQSTDALLKPRVTGQTRQLSTLRQGLHKRPSFVYDHSSLSKCASRVVVFDMFVRYRVKLV